LGRSYQLVADTRMADSSLAEDQHHLRTPLNIYRTAAVRQL
jgi:hypothetical protein